VEYLLRKQSRDVYRLRKWRDEVVGTWFSSGDQTPRGFLRRANTFLRRHVDKETELMTDVTTQSYVAFMRMSSLSSFLLFEYLEARKLEDASAHGGAGGSSPLLLVCLCAAQHICLGRSASSV
jgi:hypothetical protein